MSFLAGKWNVFKHKRSGDAPAYNLINVIFTDLP